MYDIDRALRRLELAHRLEELDKARTGATPSDGLPVIPSPTPVPPTSAPTEVITDMVADPVDDPATPRTLPNGLPVRTPGTRFRTQRPESGRETSGPRVVIPLGEPLPPVGSAETAHRLLARANPLAPPSAPPAPLPPTAGWESRSGWAADHDVAGPAVGGPVPAAAPAEREAAARESAARESRGHEPSVPGEVSTRPGQLPVSELLAGLLTPPPSGPISRAPRGAFTPALDLPGAMTTAGDVVGPAVEAEAPRTAETRATQAPTIEVPATGAQPTAESSAAERIAAMLRGGASDLLA